MNYSKIKKTDGVGVRVSLFVSGCTHHCKGCFNEETWDFNAGKLFTEETADEIITALSPYYIAGLTLIGGEPCNQPTLYELVTKIKELCPKKNIWCYTFETDILAPDGRAHCSVTDKLLSMIDVLVDGEFVLEQKNLLLKFRGSENQRIILVPQSLAARRTILSPLNFSHNKLL